MPEKAPGLKQLYFAIHARGIMIDTKLLEILACPSCKGDIEYDAKNEKIICIECGLKYPVRDGIPVMLVEEAEKPDSAG